MPSGSGTLCKACVPCSKRKIKCNASATGLPCGKCIERGCRNSCVRPVRHPRTNRKIKQSMRQPSSPVLSQSPPALPQPQTQASSGAAQKGPPDDAPVIQEDRAQRQICQEIAVRGQPVSAQTMASPSSGRDVVQYHSETNFVSMLGEIAGDQKANRVTRIVVPDPFHFHRDNGMNTAGLGGARSDNAELTFLRAKGALSLPPKQSCEELFKFYFDICYSTAPFFNRVEFLQSFESGQYSLFLVQAVLAYAAQYAPLQLLASCGFKDRSDAHRILVSRATYLYDLGYERSQLRLLQGSMILGATFVPATADKDFRYWLQNAARLAAIMGLHKKDIVEEVDSEAYKLGRRIWWGIYVRDVLMRFTGWRNMRMLDSSDFSTTAITEDDWEEENIDDQYQSILRPISQQEKTYFVEWVNLSLIAEKCLFIIKDEQEANTEQREIEVTAGFTSWRQSLPSSLQVKPCPKVNGQNKLPIKLAADSYRVECILYRSLQRKYRNRNQDRYLWAQERLEAAMFELDALIARAVAERLIDILCLTFLGCITTVLALRIESNLHLQKSDISRQMDYNYIRQNMLVLMEARDIPAVEWTVGLFEWLLGQKGLLERVGLPRGLSEDESNQQGILPDPQYSCAKFPEDVSTMFNFQGAALEIPDTLEDDESFWKEFEFLG